MDDESGGFDYQRIVQDALRDAVRRVLAQVAENGLPGEHFFYLGFRTDGPGIGISRGLRQQYPQKMTIILQNQYWDLEVGPEAFSVSLKFNGVRERLTVPFAALTDFVDPSAEFGLRFDGEGDAKAAGERAEASEPGDTESVAGRPQPGKQGSVVPFDPSRRR